MGIRSGVDVRDNSIRITFTHEGKQQRKTLMLNRTPMAPTLPNARYAERLVAEIKEKIRLGSYRAGDYFPDEGPAVKTRTVGQQMDRWESAKAVAGSTAKGYKSAVNFWKGTQYEDDSDRVLGDLPIVDLRPTHVRYVFADRSDLSGKTLKNYLGPLKEAMDWCVEDTVIPANPIAKMTAPKWQKLDPDPFSLHESDQIIAHMSDHHPGQVHNLTQFWFWTGLRTSEVFGLKWNSIDFAKKTATIHEVLVRGNEKTTTKTGVVRHLHLNSHSMAAIHRQREHTLLAGAEVFNDPRYLARWDDERAFRRSFWSPALTALGMRYRRPYQMRHSYATRFLESQVNPAFAAEQMGHSLEIFLRTYAKWLGGDRNLLEMSKLEAMDAGIRAELAAAAINAILTQGLALIPGLSPETNQPLVSG